MFDRRLYAFRPDLAEASLRGKVEAKRFVEGEKARVAVPVVPLRAAPDAAKGIDTELLFGEDITVFERRDGWCWVKASADGYVGYLPESSISNGMSKPTHIVLPQRTFLYPEPELRKPYVGVLSMGSCVRVAEAVEGPRHNRYVVLEDGTAIFEKHVKPIAEIGGDDYVDIALRFMETPYLWGGRSGLGIDCSGLVQLSLMMAGRSAPRDTDMQATSLGEPIEREELRRGDLVFWPGHVAIMEDSETIVHANGHTMSVVRENFAAAIERIGWLYDLPTGYRRP
jgi:cell wall-associated NlpC family hydrolase